MRGHSFRLTAYIGGLALAWTLLTAFTRVGSIASLYVHGQEMYGEQLFSAVEDTVRGMGAFRQEELTDDSGKKVTRRITRRWFSQQVEAVFDVPGSNGYVGLSLSMKVGGTSVNLIFSHEMVRPFPEKSRLLYDTLRRALDDRFGAANVELRWQRGLE